MLEALVPNQTTRAGSSVMFLIGKRSDRHFDLRGTCRAGPLNYSWLPTRLSAVTRRDDDGSRI